MANFVRDAGKPTAEAFDFVIPSALEGRLVIINGPGASARVSAGSIYLNGMEVVTPDHFNQNVDEFDVPITLLSGTNSLVAMLESKPGAMIEVRVMADIEVALTPAVSPIASPTSDSEVTVQGTSTVPGNTIKVELDGQAFEAETGPDGAFSIIVPLDSNSINQLFVSEIGADGSKSAAVVLEVVQDSMAPNVFIDFPPDGAQLTNESIAVAGRVSDLLSGFMGLVVVVNGMPAAVDVGVGTNGTFELTDLILPLGVSTIEAVAVDAVGNTRSVSITIERVPLGGPNMVVVSGNGQQAQVNSALPEPIVVQVRHPDGSPFVNKVVTFDVTRSNGRLSANGANGGALMLQALTDVDGFAQASWSMGSDAGCGNNRVAVTSTSINGTTFFCASALPGPASQINIGSGNHQRGLTGASLPEALSVWVNDACNGIAGIPVTFRMTRGSGFLVVPGENPSFEVTVLADLTGHAEVGLILGPDGGNRLVEATFLGNPGSSAVFVAVGVPRIPGQPTSLRGVVQDNGGAPVAGTLCILTVDGDTLQATSQADGLFTIENIPGSGPGELVVDPPGSFPGLAFDVMIVEGAQNTMPAPILLPILDPLNERFYSTTVLTILEVDGVAGLQIIIAPGSMSIDGVPAADGTPVSLNQVHHDDIPMPMKDGAAPPFAWTLQPAGALFDPPAQIVYPNISGLPAGSIAYFLVFNHDTGEFEIVATGAVTDDGTLIVSDPGVGISIAGWGCNCPPYSVTGDCENCEQPLENACDKVSKSTESAQAAAFINNALEKLTSKIPGLSAGEAKIEGEIFGEICPICCDGEELFPGTVALGGSVTGGITIDATLPNLPNFDFKIGPTDSFCGTFELNVSVELGPKVTLSPELKITGSGTRNLCTNTNCFRLGGQASTGITLALVADASVGIIICGGEENEVSVGASASVSSSVQLNVDFASADCNNPGTTVTGCFGDLTGVLTVDLGFFGEHSSPTFTFIKGTCN